MKKLMVKYPVSNDDIRQYILEKFGNEPRNSWIAHAKEVYGIPVRKARNRVSEKRLWSCPKSHFEELKSAFIHFEMIES